MCNYVWQKRVRAKYNVNVEAKVTTWLPQSHGLFLRKIYGLIDNGFKLS